MCSEPDQHTLEGLLRMFFGMLRNPPKKRIPNFGGHLMRFSVTLVKKVQRMVQNSKPFRALEKIEAPLIKFLQPFPCRSQPLIIPFRESKLTRLFQGFFCGRGRASMVVNVNMCASMFDETFHVMKFSAIAKKVRVKEGSFLKKLWCCVGGQ